MAPSDGSNGSNAPTRSNVQQVALTTTKEKTKLYKNTQTTVENGKEQIVKCNELAIINTKVEMAKAC